MPSVMRSINVISRAFALYRTEKLGENLNGCQQSMILFIMKNPGTSQENIAKNLCLNKSTVTRGIAHLMEEGYIMRETDAADKRFFKIYPTQKMTEVCGRIREINREWNAVISSEIGEEKMSVFSELLKTIEKKARETVLFGEDV